MHEDETVAMILVFNLHLMLGRNEKGPTEISIDPFVTSRIEGLRVLTRQKIIYLVPINIAMHDAIAKKQLSEIKLILPTQSNLTYPSVR